MSEGVEEEDGPVDGDEGGAAQGAEKQGLHVEDNCPLGGYGQR